MPENPFRATELHAQARGLFDLPTGSPVPGSRLLRSYCRACLEPIRVASPTPGDRCQDCLPASVSYRRQPGPPVAPQPRPSPRGRHHGGA